MRVPTTVIPLQIEQSDRPDSAVCLVLLRISGYALILIGFLVLAAWATGNLEYIQLDQSHRPLHYNAALGFLMWGGSYLAIVMRRPRLARVGAVGLMAEAVAASLTQIPSLKLSLNQWAFSAPPSLPPFPAAGMIPPMILALGLAGVALFVAARDRITRVHSFVCGLIGLALVIGVPAIVLREQGNAPMAQSAKPSLLGAIGVGLAGLALLAGLLRRELQSCSIGPALPLAVGVLGILLTLALWWTLNGEQHRRILRQVQFDAAHLHRHTQEQLTLHLGYVSERAQRWEAADIEKNRSEIGAYVGRVPACLGVARVDSQLHVNWIEVRQNQPPASSLEEMGIAEPIAAAVRSSEPVVVRPARSYWRGTRVLIIFAPHQEHKPNGGLISVLRLQDLFDTIVNINFAAGYAISITEYGESIFSRSSSDLQYRDEWNQTLPLTFQNFDWRISVWPTRDILERENLSLPKLALIIGLLTTGLLMLAVHLAQTARHRTFELEKEVHERELTQRALSQSEQKYRTLIENLGQGIFLQDSQHRYVAANAQFCRSVGRTEADIIGRTESDLFDPRRAAIYSEEAQTVLSEGKSVECEEDVVINGRRTNLRRVLTPVRDGNGQTTGVLGICWDVTEQRQLEAHVHQASKMDAIGQLAGGIAHDFNNLLTVILGNLELILAALPPGDRNRELTNFAHHAATRAASLTQRLLGFSRQHQLDWAPTNLNTIVEEVVSLLRRTIDPLIRIETRFDPNLWPVNADAAQLNQVLMNLCLNARDAITGPGHILIETSCIANGELPLGRHPVGRHGDFVRLSVTDSGSGMADEVKARIFEPFFTTKPVGKGTGLGLPMVFAIVRQHKGWIDCWSAVGQGTRFDIYLPRGEPAKATVAPPVTSMPRGGGKETILVVDDEEMIRGLAAAALKSAGYNVIEATDGQHAIDLYSQEGERIDLVLLDLTMPTLSGHDAFRHLLKLNPRVRVLFASGYAVENLSDLEKELMAGFIKKPYRPSELIVAVEEALTSRDALSDAKPEEVEPVLT